MAKLAVATWAAIGVGIAAVSAVQQYKEGKKQSASLERSADLQAKAAEATQRQNELRAARERRQQYRQSRLIRQEMTNVAGAGPEGGGSSSFLTARGSAGTQAGANVSFINQNVDLAQQQSIFNIGAMQAETQAQQAALRGSMWGSLGSVGTSIFGNAKGLNAIEWS